MLTLTEVCVNSDLVLQRPLSATSLSLSVWLPYTSIDQLLQILGEANSCVSPEATHSSLVVPFIHLG